MKKTSVKNNQKDRKFGQILGINILSTQTAELLERVTIFLSHNKDLSDKKKRFSIVTVNPELILMALNNRELKKALNLSALPVAEAVGVAQAHKFLSLKLPQNKILRCLVAFGQGLVVGGATFFKKKWLTKEVKPLKGRVLFLNLIKLAARKRYRVFLLGGETHEARLTASNLKAKYRNLKIMSYGGPILNANAKPVTLGDKEKEKDAVDMINNFKPHLLFVSFGNPKQEIWIQKNISKLTIGGAMAVGGTFRYVAGLSSLPPKFLEGLGLEWAWRFITEPHRLIRIVRATIVFPITVYLHKVKN